MNRSYNLFAYALLAHLLVALPLTVNATVIYQYVGNDFVNVKGPYYDTTDRVEGFFELSDALSPNAVSLDITLDVVSYSFSDGVQTFTQDTPLKTTSFLVSTNALGDIIEWGIMLIYGTELERFAIRTHNMLDASLVRDSGRHGPRDIETRGLVHDAPGVFSRAGQTASSATLPEPPTLLLSLGALGIAGFCSRLKRIG